MTKSARSLGMDTPDASPAGDLYALAPAKGERIARGLLFGLAVVCMISLLAGGLFATAVKSDNHSNSYTPLPSGHRALYNVLGQKGWTLERGGRFVSMGDLNLPGQDALPIFLEPRIPYIEDLAPGGLNHGYGTPLQDESFILVLPKFWYTREENSNILKQHVVSKQEHEEILDAFNLEPLKRLLQELPGPLPVTQSTRWIWQKQRRNSNTRFWEESPFEGYALDAMVTPLPGEGARFQHPLGFQMEWEWNANTIDDICEELEAVLGETTAIRVLADYEGQRFAWAIALVQTSRTIVVVADPTPFTNQYLEQGPNMWLIEQLLESTRALNINQPLGGRILNSRKLSFDEAFHGYTDDATIAWYATQGDGLWVTFSIMGLLLLLIWHQAIVVRPLPSDQRDRRSRAYVIEGLARLMQRARGQADIAHRLYRRAAKVGARDASVVMQAGGAAIESTESTAHQIEGIPAPKGNDPESLLALSLAIAKREQAARERMQRALKSRPKSMAPDASENATASNFNSSDPTSPEQGRS